MNIKTRKDSIMRQISRPLVIFIAIIIVTNAVFLFFYNMRQYIKDRFTSANMIGHITAREMEDYECLGFAVRYWRENYESMRLIYDADELMEAENELYAELAGYGIYEDIYNIQAEKAMALNDEEQKLLAEVIYGRICVYMDKLKRIYSPLYLYTIAKPDIEDDELFYFCTGAFEDEQRISQGGILYELGVRIPYIKGAYPTLDKVITTGDYATEMELSLRSGADRSAAHAFVPVFCDGEVVAIVGISMQWRDMLVRVLGISLTLLIIQTFLFTLVAFITRNLVRRVVAWPLARQRAIIKVYEENKDSKAAAEKLSTIKSNNELEELAGSFSSMVSELDRYVDEIRSVTAEKERIGAELNVATQIQADMLPSIFPPFPDRKEFDIYASMDPAKEVGGDFYDFFLIDDDHLGLVMADVSGKGVPAALFMVISKTLIKDQAQVNTSPKDILEKVNNMLCENNAEGMFVTVWLGIMEISTGKITASNAGHEYPMIRGRDGRYELYKDKHGMVAGVTEDIEYTEYEFTLDKGGALFIYTDGVPEATRADNEMFGLEKMTEALNKEPMAEPKKLLENVRESVDEFVGDAPQFDDLTMLCIVYNG